jgi:hypothetical protein
MEKCQTAVCKGSYRRDADGDWHCTLCAKPPKDSLESYLHEGSPTDAAVESAA